MVASISKSLLVDTKAQKEQYNMIYKTHELATSLMAIDPSTYFISWQLLQKKMLTKVMDMDSDFFSIYGLSCCECSCYYSVYISPLFTVFLDFAAFCSSLSLRVWQKEKKDTFGRNSPPMWEFHVHEIVENTKHLNKISLFLIQKTVACEEISNPIYHQSMFFCLYCYHKRAHLIVFKGHGCSTK